MSSSTFLDNQMRFGEIAHNARVNLAGTVVSITTYLGVAYSPADSLLVRFNSTQDSVVVAGIPSCDFGAATWALPANDGVWAIQVGIQRIDAASVQLVCGLSRESGDVTSVIPANALHPYLIVGTASETGPICWIATLHGVVRSGGTWDTSTATIEEN